MKVRDLIEFLSKFDDDHDVRIETKHSYKELVNVVKVAPSLVIIKREGL